MVSSIARQAQFAPWGNAMCVIKRLIVTDGYRVRKDFTIASCVGFRSDGLEDLALLIICVIWVGGMLGVCWARCWLRPRRPGYVTIQCWGDTQRRAVAEPTLVRRVLLCTMYDTLMKRVCVCNNVRWVSVRTIRYHALHPESVVMYVTIRGSSVQAEGSGQAVACGQWTLADQNTFTLPMLLHPSRRSSQCGAFLVWAALWYRSHYIRSTLSVVTASKAQEEILCPRFHFHFWFLLPRPAAPLSVSATCWLKGLSTVDFFSMEHLFGIKQIFTILVIGLY